MPLLYIAGSVDRRNVGSQSWPGVGGVFLAGVPARGEMAIQRNAQLLQASAGAAWGIGAVRGLRAGLRAGPPRICQSRLPPVVSTKGA